MSARILVCTLLMALCVHAAPAAGKDERDAQREDLDFASREYVMRSMAFSPEGRAAALTHIAALKARAGTMTRGEFLAAAMAIAAFAHNGHNSFDPGDGWLPQARLPYRVIWFDDALMIARAARDTGLAGARITAIDGMPVAQVLERLGRYDGGPSQYIRWNSAWILSVPELLHAMEIAEASDAVTLDVILPDGTAAQRMLRAVPVADVPRGVLPDRYWNPAPYPGEAEHGWTQAMTLASPPLYMQEPDTLYRMRRLPALDALYVQLRINFDFNGQTIAPFVAAIEKDIQAHPPHNLILDMRFNTGGDIDQTRELLRALAGATTGRIYVLTSHYTFSAGLVSAAAMRHDAPGKVTIIGSQVGDNLRFWSEGEKVCMPNSHYCLHVTTGLWDLTRGCAGEPGCYGDRLDARVATVAPDIAAPILSADWIAGRDPGMDAVARDLKGRSAP